MFPSFSNNNLPTEYVLEKFYQYAGKPKKVGTKYNASCPICREGTSWLKKKRLYFYPHSNTFQCHNCQRSWSAIGWIKQVTGQEPKSIFAEARSQYGEEMASDGFFKKDTKEEYTLTVPDVPNDAINLFNEQEIEFYKSNKTVQYALKYIRDRRLHLAVNKPKAIYVSLTDRIHKNRILLPFYDFDGKKILFYQTRELFKKEDSAKYISKINAEKTICGINNIDLNIPYIFNFEGPIDSFFVKNGTALAGIQYTIKQRMQLETLEGFYQKIWVLDNPVQDKNQEVYDKILELIDRNELVFIWPRELQQYKDINEFCMDKELNEVPYQLFVKYAKRGNEAKIALGQSRY